MKTTQQLYGIDPHELAEMSYRGALILKIEASSFRIQDLAAKARSMKQETEEYSTTLELYYEAKKAKEFNVKLLEELDA